MSPRVRISVRAAQQERRTPARCVGVVVERQRPEKVGVSGVRTQGGASAPASRAARGPQSACRPASPWRPEHNPAPTWLRSERRLPDGRRRGCRAMSRRAHAGERSGPNTTGRGALHGPYAPRRRADRRSARKRSRATPWCLSPGAPFPTQVICQWDVFQPHHMRPCARHTRMPTRGHDHTSQARGRTRGMYTSPNLPNGENCMHTQQRPPPRPPHPSPHTPPGAPKPPST